MWLTSGYGSDRVLPLPSRRIFIYTSSLVLLIVVYVSCFDCIFLRFGIHLPQAPSFLSAWSFLQLSCFRGQSSSLWSQTIIFGKPSAASSLLPAVQSMEHLAVKLFCRTQD